MNYGEVTFVPPGLSIGILKTPPGFFKPGEILVVPLELQVQNLSLCQRAEGQKGGMDQRRKGRREEWQNGG